MILLERLWFQASMLKVDRLSVFLNEDGFDWLLLIETYSIKSLSTLGSSKTELALNFFTDSLGLSATKPSFT